MIDVGNSVFDLSGSGNGSNAESTATEAPRTAAMQIQGDADFSFTTFKLPGTPLGVQVNNRALSATNSLFDGVDGLNLGMDTISSIDLSGSVADVPDGLTVFLNGSEVPADDVVTDNGGTVAAVTLNEEGQVAKSTALTVDYRVASTSCASPGRPSQPAASSSSCGRLVLGGGVL
jgi:hypothetical protein